MKEPNEAINFKSRTDIRRWAKKQPHDVLKVFAARAALRAIPFFAPLIRGKSSSQKMPSAITLPSLWATNSALSAGTWPNRATYAAAAYAAVANANANAGAYVNASAAYAAICVADADAAANAAANAAYAAYAAADPAYAAYAAANPDPDADADADAYTTCSNDANATANGLDAKELAFAPLWSDGKTPMQVTEHWENLKTFLLNLNEDWDVWTDWYESILRGGPRNPDLEIARISFPHKDYTNAKVLNPKIKELIDTFNHTSKQEHLEALSASTPLAETIVLTEDGKFDVEFLPPRELFNNNLQRLGSALDNVIKKNTFTPSSDEILFLRAVIEDHEDNPQRVYDDCRLASASIRDLIENQIIDDGFSVKRLLDAVELTANDIRAYEPLVQEVIAKRAAFFIDNEATPNINADTDVAEHLNTITQITSDRLGHEITQDTKDVLTVFVGRDRALAIYRLISRYSRMSLQIIHSTGQASSDATMLALIKAQPHLEAMLAILKPFILSL